MKNLSMIGVAVLAVACSGKEEEPDLCETITVEVTVVDSSEQPVTNAEVKFDDLDCTGDGTTNVYSCEVTQDPLGKYQLSILAANSNAYSQLVVLPAPEDWCTSSPFAVGAMLGVMMGS